MPATVIEFGQPAWLWGLLLLPPFIWLSLRGGNAGRRMHFAAPLRALQLGMILLALARPSALTPVLRNGLAAVVDRTPSTEGAGRAEADRFLASVADKLGADIPVIPFGTTPGVASDVTSALRMARAFVPAEGGRILLLSDGQWLASANELADSVGRGTAIDTVSLPVFAGPEAGIVGIEFPGGLRAGDRFILRVDLFSTRAQSATLRMYLDGVLETETTVDPTPGVGGIELGPIQATAGAMRIALEIETAADFYAPNNRIEALIPVEGPAKILLVDSDPARVAPLAASIENLGFAVTAIHPSALAGADSLLADLGLLVLSDVAAADLPGGAVESIGAWIASSGGGLLLTGGENAFGGGGYAGSPLAGLLPLEAAHQERETEAVTALLVVLDSSGSMSAPVGSRTKMSLANEGAARALDTLGPHDWFGALAVDTRPKTIVPLERSQDRRAARSKLLATGVGGGGIYIHTALAEAWRQLRAADARIKHVIVFGDAADIEEKFQGEPEGKPSGPSALDLATAMLGSGITISVVALGHEADPDTRWLRELVERGRGRFYLTSDASELPKLFAREAARAAAPNLLEDPFFAVPTAAGDAVFATLDWALAPPLLGCNQTRLKPGATLLIEASDGLPLLAWWRYGLGQVAAFAADLHPRWAAEWLDWRQWPQFLDLVLRRLVRRGAENGQLPGVELTHGPGGMLEILVDSGPAGEAGAHRTKPAVAVAPLDAESFQLELEQVAPGVFLGALPAPQVPVAITATDPTRPGQLRRTTWSPPASLEFRAIEPDATTLRKLAFRTGGEFNPSPADVAGRAMVRAAGRVPLAPWLLGLVAVVLLAEVGARRLVASTARANRA